MQSTSSCTSNRGVGIIDRSLGEERALQLFDEEVDETVIEVFTSKDGYHQQWPRRYFC